MIMFLIFGLIGCLLGLLLMSLYIYFKKQRIDMKSRCTCTINGSFVKFGEKPYSGGIRLYVISFFPVYEYCVDGKKYEVQSMLGISERNVSLIEKNKLVCYNPNKLEESFIKYEEINGYLVNMLILSVIFFIIGIVFIILYFVLKTIVQ